MKKISLIAAMLMLSASYAFAERGLGLHREFKTIFIPESQQSGWGLQTESMPQVEKPVAKKAEPAPVAVAQAPVDSDNDGVVDDNDDCLGTPAGVKVDSKGCPLGQKAVPTDSWVLNGVRFESGSDKLKSESEAELNDAAQVLNTHSKVRVEIQGHTDSMGDAAFNQSLSEKRAISVKNYLTGKGVSADRLETKGFGPSSPIADNKTADGRAKNRRIEFKVLSR